MISNRLRKEELLEVEEDLPFEKDLPFEEAGSEKFPKYSSGRSMLSLLLASDIVAKEKALAFLPYFLFLAILGMFYIGNRHLAEKKSREVNQLKKEIKEMKWDYMSTKAELMLQSKQSEVAGHAKELGLMESIHPPAKIVIEEK